MEPVSVPSTQNVCLQLEFTKVPTMSITPSFITPERPIVASCLPRRPFKTSKFLGSHCFFPVISTCKTLCLSSKSRLCLLESCGAPAIKPCWPTKLNALEAPPPGAGPLGWGAWHSVRALTPVEEALQYNYPSVCGSPTQGYGI